MSAIFVVRFHFTDGLFAQILDRTGLYIILIYSHVKNTF